MAGAKPGQHHMQSGPSVTHQHMQSAESAANQDQPAQTHEQQNSSCNNAGVCHFACIGYLATVVAKMMEAQSLVQTYIPFSSQFQSITSIPLDPPPLVRV